MRKIIAVIIVIFCGSAVCVAQEKSKASATRRFSRVIKAYPTKEDVTNELVEYP